MNYKTFAKNWITKKGLFDKDSDYDGMIGRALMRLVKTHSDEKHSGMSSGWTLKLFQMLNDDYNNPESEGWKEYWESDEGKAFKKQYDK